MRKPLLHIVLPIVLITIFSGCVEPFDAATEDFESALVVDALITNEIKQQEIHISRTFKFEEQEATGESGATVRLVDNTQREYLFEETDPGVYVSADVFGAQPNTAYQLFITTRDGRQYLSSSVTLPRTTSLENLYAAKETNDLGIEGVSILADTFDPTGESRYYRYDYEETYKIIAPFWNPQEFEIVTEDPIFIRLVPKTKEEQVCYNTVNSVSFILGDTSGFSEDRLTRFPIRFLARDNYIIGHRYSILVKQYVISREAYIFYQTLNEFSGLESIFSENQPGFFNGNISSQESPNEKVIGFFDVSSVDQKRIFFNNEEFFPDDLIPSFPDDCEITTPITSELINGIKFGNVKFWAQHEPEDASQGDFKVVPAICGDCTVLGTNVVPEFWIE